MIIVNSTVLYLKVANRVDLTSKKWQFYDVMEVLANTTVVIILQDINLSNQYLTLTRYVSYVSVKIGEGSVALIWSERGIFPMYSSPFCNISYVTI